MDVQGGLIGGKLPEPGQKHKSWIKQALWGSQHHSESQVQSQAEEGHIVQHASFQTRHLWCISVANSFNQQQYQGSSSSMCSGSNTHGHVTALLTPLQPHCHPPPAAQATSLHASQLHGHITASITAAHITTPLPPTWATLQHISQLHILRYCPHRSHTCRVTTCLTAAWAMLPPLQLHSVTAHLTAAQHHCMHQQKKTCLQLPYNALLCLTEPVRHNKAL